MNKSNSILNSVDSIEKIKADLASPTHRYEIFKGTVDSSEKIIRTRSVGSAYLKEGQTTLTLTLKTFLDDRFYLMPDIKKESPGNYVIFTREIAHTLKRKYFWNAVGEGKILDGVNHGLMKLSWDVLAGDLYMSLHPIHSRDSAKASNQVEEAEVA